MTSPTARTLEWFRKEGYLIGTVERWLNIPNHPAGGQRSDLFGFVDLIACCEGSLVPGHFLFLQVTTAGSMGDRVKKIMEERSSEARIVLNSGGKIQVWGWRKLKNKGRRKWFAKRREIVLSSTMGAEGPRFELAVVDMEDL